MPDAIYTFNIIVMNEHVRLPFDKEFLFGPFEEGDVFHEVDPGVVRWPEFLVERGLFPSKGQARKAGFKEWPEGWTDRTVGKKTSNKTRFCIWNPSQ